MCGLESPPTPICIFEGIMNAPMYINIIFYQKEDARWTQIYVRQECVNSGGD